MTAAGRAGGTVADAVAPPPRHPRFPLIDGMRAVAVLCVVVVHAAFFSDATGESLGGQLLSHLNLGVTIFFVISGFLLYRPFIAERGGGPPAPAVTDYARRRFLRIFPAYWLALTILVLIPGMTGVVSGEGLLQYSLLHTLPLAEGGGCTVAFDECGLAQTWSLVVELTFYVALPLYVVASRRLVAAVPQRHWLGAELGFLAGMSVLSVLLHFAVETTSMRPVAGGSAVGFAYWFALGMGLAAVSVSFGDRRPGSVVRTLASRPELPWLAAVGLYALLCLVLPGSPFIFDRGDAALAHIGFGAVALLLMLPAVIGWEEGGAPRALLERPAVAWLGLVSYGIFLWHYPVVLELSEAGVESFVPLLAATLAITVPVAAASYYAVERPLLRLKYRRGESAEVPRTTAAST